MLFFAIFISSFLSILQQSTVIIYPAHRKLRRKLGYQRYSADSQLHYSWNITGIQVFPTFTQSTERMVLFSGKT